MTYTTLTVCAEFSTFHSTMCAKWFRTNRMNDTITSWASKIKLKYHKLSAETVFIRDLDIVNRKWFYLSFCKKCSCWMQIQEDLGRINLLLCRHIKNWQAQTNIELFKSTLQVYYIKNFIFIVAVVGSICHVHLFNPGITPLWMNYKWNAHQLAAFTIIIIEYRF